MFQAVDVQVRPCAVVQVGVVLLQLRQLQLHLVLRIRTLTGHTDPVYEVCVRSLLEDSTFIQGQVHNFCAGLERPVEGQAQRVGEGCGAGDLQGRVDLHPQRGCRALRGCEGQTLTSAQTLKVKILQEILFLMNKVSFCSEISFFSAKPAFLHAPFLSISTRKQQEAEANRKR